MSGPFTPTTIRWSDPKLTLAQEIEIGAEVHRVGRKALIEQFLAPYQSDTSPAQTKQDRTEKIGLRVMAVGAAALAVVFAPQTLVNSVGVTAYHHGAFHGSKRIAAWKYGRWLDRCLEKFHDDARRAK